MKEIMAISDKLDFLVQISLKVNQEMDLMFAHMDDPVPLYATIEDDKANISIYLDKIHNPKIDRILGNTTCTSKGNYEIYELKAEDLVFEFQMFRKITNVPSVVPGGFYLDNGYVYADFRFHHSALDQIGELIREIVEARNRIKLSYLGPSQGLLKTLESINSRMPLSMIFFTFKPDPGYIAPDRLEEKPVAEVKLFSEGLESTYDVVYYATEPRTHEFSISVSEGIYEAKYRTTFMREFKRRFRTQKIPLASMIGVYLKDLVENYMFVPTFMADEALGILYEITGATHDTSLKLNSFVSFENIS